MFSLSCSRNELLEEEAIFNFEHVFYPPNCLSVFVYMYVRKEACRCIEIYVKIHTNSYICTQIYMYTHTRTQTCIYVCVYTVCVYCWKYLPRHYCSAVTALNGAAVLRGRCCESPLRLKTALMWHFYWGASVGPGRTRHCLSNKSGFIPNGKMTMLREEGEQWDCHARGNIPVTF